MVDYPNSRKARKMYLCLMVGQQEIPKALEGGEVGVEERQRRKDEVKNEKRRRKMGAKMKKGRKDVTAKDWVLKKKELYRQRGKEGYVSILAVWLDQTNICSIGCRGTRSIPPGSGGYSSETTGSYLTTIRCMITLDSHGHPFRCAW